MTLGVISDYLKKRQDLKMKLDMKLEIIQAHILQSQSKIMISRWYLFVSVYDNIIFTTK